MEVKRNPVNRMHKYHLSSLICLLLFLTILFTGCRRPDWISIDTEPTNAYPTITIADENMKSPLRFIGESSGITGTFYFETPAGKTWLKNRPEIITQTKIQTELKWKIGERDVILSFRKNTGSYHFSISAKPARDITGWGIRLAATENEYLTGLFERTIDGDQKKSWKKGITAALNLHGQEVDMIIKPTLSLYTPFYLSSNGYGLFIEGTWPGHYDFCKSEPDRISISFEGQEMSGIIYASKNLADIVKAHSLHIGPTIIPPRWAFLPWRWRDSHTNKESYYDGTPVKAPYNSMVVEDILMMKALDIPCGVYWVDRPWAKGVHGYEDFEWDPERFPEAGNMIEWIHSNNIKFLVWIPPWVAGNTRLEANRNGYSIAIKDQHGSIDSSNAALIDFTNPSACKWWQEKGIKKMLLEGVNGFKLDRSEELIPETYEQLFYDGRTAKQVRNEYPLLYVKTVYEVCNKIRNDDFVLIPCAGYSGSSKYSGFRGGDIGTPSEGLRAAIIAVQRCAIIGFPIWGSDIGGYLQGNFDREVCARWLAFGCFTPIMEFGPTDDRAPWDMPEEPNYDTTLIAIWRLYAKIHASLADYSHSLAVQANETGAPIVRPLFLVAPDEKEAWDDWQTFMYGSDILVSTIWRKGITTHKLYLPGGSRWRDAWNTEILFEGGQTIEVQTPIYKIPVFLREDSEINLGDLNELYNKSYAIAQHIPDLGNLEKQIPKLNI
jgi:alpha-glucosidase (family GH31 glycosyl hydrolase)